MAYRLEADESVRAGLVRVAREQLGRALAALEDPDARPALAVHGARTRAKKLRALLRLFAGSLPRSVVRDENGALRRFARELSDLRDADALLEAHRRLERDACEGEEDERLFARVLAALGASRAGVHRRSEVPVRERLDRAAELLREVEERVPDWRPDRGGFDALEDGLVAVHRRARARMAEALDAPGPTTFHEWRKRAKDHWYHLRLLERSWPRVVGAARREAEVLAEDLGDAHDLDLLEVEVAGLEDLREDERERYLARLVARRAELRERAGSLGARLFAEAPRAHARRLRTYYDAWRREGRQASG